MGFSERQKRIASWLVSGAKTVDELRTQSNIPTAELHVELKELLRLELVTKQEGFPTRYALKENITTEVLRRKELAKTDSNPLRVHAIIEGQAVESTLLKKQLSKLADALKKDKGFGVYDVSQAPVLKQGEAYSSFLDVNVSVKDFKTLVLFMYTYGPTTVEIVSHDKIVFSGSDLQEGLNDWSDWIHRYAELLTKQMNREELEEFNRRLTR
ncbi:MAG: hypothetical protein Q7R47_07005 [Candidatus Diapherotrites archaeon]|nr:hypothetical protein [Candidatus Diapherotrites archaeon]